MEQHQEVRLSFEEGCDQTIDVTPLGNNLYRLETTPLFIEEKVSFGDIIEVDPQASGVLRFCRVVERSPWRHWDWLLAQDVVESAFFQALQHSIEAHGGLWEQTMGGIFFVHLPPDADFDPEAALGKL